MLSDALRYPANSDGWIRTILIGGLLTVLSVLILPWFLLQGYYVRVLHGVTNDDPVPPRFDEWGDLLVDGLKLFVLNVLVTIVFLGVQVAAAALADAGSFLSAPPTGPAGPGSAPSALVIFGLFGVILLISYVVPAMFANFAREDSLAAAFDVSAIRAGALTREYLIAWVLAVVVGVVLGFVASLLSLLLVGLFGLFYVQVVTYYLFGRGFAEGLDTGGNAEAVTY
jgi:hypothetical protein